MLGLGDSRYPFDVALIVLLSLSSLAGAGGLAVAVLVEAEPAEGFLFLVPAFVLGVAAALRRAALDGREDRLVGEQLGGRVVAHVRLWWLHGARVPGEPEGRVIVGNGRLRVAGAWVGNVIDLSVGDIERIELRRAFEDIPSDPAVTIFEGERVLIQFFPMWGFDAGDLLDKIRTAVAAEQALASDASNGEAPLASDASDS